MPYHQRNVDHRAFFKENNLKYKLCVEIIRKLYLLHLTSGIKNRSCCFFSSRIGTLPLLLSSARTAPELTYLRPPEDSVTTRRPAGLPRSAARGDLLNFVIFGRGVAVKINVRPIA